VSNPLVTSEVDAPKDPWAGVWIVEDIELLCRGVQDGSRTLPDGSIVLFPTGFHSEEDLPRTLAYKKFHHDELAAGKPFPKTEQEFDAFEDRAYVHEEQWWNSQPIRP
jgi:hypothetical protein